MANSKANRGKKGAASASKSSAAVKSISRRSVTYGKKPGRTAADVIAEARGQKANLLYCIPAFLIPFLLTFVSYICFDVYPFGERSVLTLDLNGQYIYYFEALRDAFWGDGSALYSWSRNLSGGFMGIIGYYLASPFTLIVMLLPRKMIIESMMIMQMCKVGAAGVTFCIYAQKSKRLRPLESVMFSTMYSMMSYIVIQLIDPMWIDGPIFLPLIILGVEYLIDDGRKINYIIPLALMFIANFYIGFMIAIFVAIYFFYYLFFGTNRKFKNISEYITTFIRMGISTVVVLMCSAIMILPVYNALALGKFDFSEPDYSYKNMFKPLELLPCLLPNQYYSVNVDEGTKYYGRPEIYCGVLTLVLVPLFFLNKKVNVKKKVGNALLMAVLFVSMYVKPINMLWHGGQDPNWLPYRYSFLVSFILVAMAAEVFANLDGYDLKYSTVGGVFGVLMLLTVLFEAKMDKYGYAQEFLEDGVTKNPSYKGYKYVAAGPYKFEMSHGVDKWEEICLGTLAFGMVLAAVYLVYVCAYSKAKKKKFKNILTIGVACLVLFETGYNCYDSFRKIFKEVGNSDKSTYTEILSAQDVVKELEDYDSGFYRAEKTYTRMVNDNLAYGLKGISHSSSVMNARAIKFIENMGFFTQSFESKYEGSNPVADSLLGIKYVLDDPNRNSNPRLLDASYIKRFSTTAKKGDDEDYTVDVYENPNALSIGYMANDDIMTLTALGNDNPFNSLNNFLSAMTGNTHDFKNIVPKEYYSPLPVNVVYDPAQINLHDYQNPGGNLHDCYEAIAGSNDPVVNVRVTMPKDGDIYFHLGSEVRKSCNVWVSSEKDENGNFKNHSGCGQYFNTNSSPIVRIGPYTAGQEIEVRFTIVGSGPNGEHDGTDEYLMVRKNFGFNFYYLNTEAFEEDINKLKENQWEIDSEKSNDRCLEGKVTAKDGEIFITSIPYEPGWTIEVDGKKVENLIYEEEYVEKDANGQPLKDKNGKVIKKTRLLNKEGSEGEVLVLGTLIGVRLPAGEHTIKMKYTPPGFNFGIITLIFGIAAIVLFYIYDRKKNPILVAMRESKAKAKERKRLGLSAEEEPDETSDRKEKKKVQIIKSKGAVDEAVSDSAKKKEEELRDEADRIESKNKELLEKGKAYAQRADEEAQKGVSETLDTEDTEQNEKTPESNASDPDNGNNKPKNGGKKNKKKKK